MKAGVLVGQLEAPVITIERHFALGPHAVLDLEEVSEVGIYLQHDVQPADLVEVIGERTIDAQGARDGPLERTR